MATPEEIIDAAITTPKKVRTSTAEIENRSIAELIAWDNHRRAVLSRRRGPFAAITLPIMPGTVGPNSAVEVV